VVGIDVSVKMHAQAEKLTKDAGMEYRLVSIEQVDLGTAFFDVVTSSLTLRYVDDYGAAVSRVVSLLVKGGRFVISVERQICTAMAPQQRVRDAGGLSGPGR
jgi:ubiquinone/menaquinone biosynthesis C-methylase UbiE